MSETKRPLIASLWLHADGGIYRVILSGGSLKDDATGAWVPSVSYDHADGNTSPDAPYHTSLKRWAERFQPWTPPTP